MRMTRDEIDEMGSAEKLESFKVELQELLDRYGLQIAIDLNFKPKA